MTGGTVSTGRLKVRVVKVSGVAWPSASVTLSNGAYSVTRQVDSGGYEFRDLPCGEYDLSATIPNGGTTATEKATVSCGQLKTKSIAVPGSSCNPLGRTPILLVPGMMGSTTVNNLIYLPRSRPAWSSSVWPVWSADRDGGLVDVLGRPGWRSLVQRLEASGYEVGCTLFPVPYDWRLPVETVARDYLEKQIGRAKTLAGVTEVDVIAHSMGGLVARAYIQGPRYKNDIDKLAMVGTPNEGATIAFPLWEGGDVKFDLYAGVSVSQYILFYGSLPRTGLEIPYGLYALYHEHIPSLSQLLPVYSALTPLLSGSSRSLSCEPNYLLLDLNDPSGARGRNRGRMMNPDGDPAKVRAQVFAGTSSKPGTLVRMIATSKAAPCSRRILYQDGIPFGKILGAGDGTVPLSSALHDFASPAAKNGDHAKLVGLYVDELEAFMVPANLRSARPVQRTATASRALTVSVQGRSQVLVVDGTGAAAGVDPVTGAAREEIAGAVVDLQDAAGGVTLSDPAPGTYTLRLQGAFDEDVDLQIHLDDGDFSETQSFRLFQQAGIESSAQLTLAAAGESRIAIQQTPAPPSGLRADRTDPGGGTALSWQASPTPGVTGYRVYSRLPDEPALTRIATVAATSFQTGDDWAGDASVPLHLYAVAAMLADGRESFLTDPVANDDRDHDGLSDAQETALGTGIANPDSDGDGLSDGEEALQGTEPLQADTDGDGYPDAREVTAGADPLDPAIDPSTLPLDLYTIVPCRLFDSRTAASPLISGVRRTIPGTGRCGIPPTAIALSANVTVVAAAGQGYVKLFPADIAAPSTSVVNFQGPQIRGNNALLRLTGRDAGTLDALATVSGASQLDLIIDVNGYFQ